LNNLALTIQPQRNFRTVLVLKHFKERGFHPGQIIAGLKVLYSTDFRYPPQAASYKKFFVAVSRSPSGWRVV
jgi:hypothetical protein